MGIKENISKIEGEIGKMYGMSPLMLKDKDGNRITKKPLTDLVDFGFLKLTGYRYTIIKSIF